jgi:2-polyprenyl-3-methyl-5-hydroxy-6-metoxy-1,4-benzoquinol methylase
VEEQICLYKEISNREFDQSENEHTTLDIEKHVAAINPYDHGVPSELAIHLQRLAKAYRLGCPPRGGRLLDMGCGWGLSSEVAAYLGLKVTGVDINRDFLELVASRALRFGFDIDVVHSLFDKFQPQFQYDMILFYECLHHALKPWTVIEQLSKHLTRNGQIVLAGEPFNEHWWKHWGLTLTPMSVYCIRKFGWFESGWSLSFIDKVFQRAGMTMAYEVDSDPQIGITAFAKFFKSGTVASAADIARFWKMQGWSFDGEQYLLFSGKGWLEFNSVNDNCKIQIRLINFRPQNLGVYIRCKEAIIYSEPLKTGENLIELTMSSGVNRLDISSETWIPDDEIKNGDKRTLTFHVTDITII